MASLAGLDPGLTVALRADAEEQRRSKEGVGVWKRREEPKKKKKKGSQRKKITNQQTLFFYLVSSFAWFIFSSASLYKFRDGDSDAGVVTGAPRPVPGAPDTSLKSSGSRSGAPSGGGGGKKRCTGSGPESKTAIGDDDDDDEEASLATIIIASSWLDVVASGIRPRNDFFFEL